MPKQKKIRKTSITLKIGLAISLLIMFLMIVVGFANYQRTMRTLETQLTDKGWSIVRTGAAFAADRLQAGNTSLLLEHMANIKANDDVTHAIIINAAGKIVAHTDPAEIGKDAVLSLPDRPVARKYRESNGQSGRMEFIAPIETRSGVRLGYFSLGLNTVKTEAMLKYELYNMVLISSAAVIAGIFLAIVLTRRILKKPIDDIMAATEHIAAGNFSHQVKVHNLDELGSLATAFNFMTAHLGNLFRSVQSSAVEINRSSQVIISRSEDVKMSLDPKEPTPDGAAAPANPGDKARQAEALREITYAARKMSRLVDRLNSLSMQFKV